MLSSSCDAARTVVFRVLSPRWTRCLVVIMAACHLLQVEAMSYSRIRALRQETEDMFYHGFDGYMKHAFPEDELRPLTCGPFARDQTTDSGCLDVLGNYSLTLIDSLSTLAIMSSLDDNPQPNDTANGRKAWGYFQKGVRDIVTLYGDGSKGPKGQGSKSTGFDLDSKVQVFETTIRGVGGLLSAHLFAVGDLPIAGYRPDHDETTFAKTYNKSGIAQSLKGNPGIRWDDGFFYDGQFLRLAVDLADRLLPAFYTPTALPYPRVNLRKGIPFFINSMFNKSLKSRLTQQQIDSLPPEATETCSAGAGSLVLEFSVLSHLTGNGLYEKMAKRAFWAVWSHRSDLDLIGSGIEAETGAWTSYITGIGAGVDSFFEYAFKSHVLLSQENTQPLSPSEVHPALDSEAPEEDQESSDAFLSVFRKALAAIRRHLYRGAGYQYPHYVQADFTTGATIAFWIDSLAAFFPGLLSFAGDIETAVQYHLLNAAVWTKFSAFPERFNVASGEAEKDMSFWPGRPEFTESNYYLYMSTGDPYYLHIGEMILKDIRRRSWTSCGWAGLVDVKTGERANRMESFFLGETVKYLYLMFNPAHPLNLLDAPFVFSTEAHPLIIPKTNRSGKGGRRKPTTGVVKQNHTNQINLSRCPAPRPLPLGFSAVPSRPNYFHAASIVRLHSASAQDQSSPGESTSDQAQTPSGPSQTNALTPSEYIFYPWPLPHDVVMNDAMCAPLAPRPLLDLAFPAIPGLLNSQDSIRRANGALFMNSLSGARFGLVHNGPKPTTNSKDGYRVQVLNNIPLRKDDKIFLPKVVTNLLSPTDKNFARITDPLFVDIVADFSTEWGLANGIPKSKLLMKYHEPVRTEDVSLPDNLETFDQSSMKLAIRSFLDQMASLFRDEIETEDGQPHETEPVLRISFPAMTSTGRGSTNLPQVIDASLTDNMMHDTSRKSTPRNPLPWSHVYATHELCDGRLSPEIPQNHQVIVVKRGGCSFSQKLGNIPSFNPSSSSLQLVIVVSYKEDDDYASDSYFYQSTQEGITDDKRPTQPLLEEVQTVVDGIPRRHPISLVMVGGGDRTYEFFRNTKGVGLKRRYKIHSQGIPISNVLLT